MLYMLANGLFYGWNVSYADFKVKNIPILALIKEFYQLEPNVNFRYIIVYYYGDIAVSLLFCLSHCASSSFSLKGNSTNFTHLSVFTSLWKYFHICEKKTV